MEVVRIRSGDPAIETRSFQIGKIRSAEDRTVEAVISSEYPVPRYDGNEILVHTPEAVDLSRAPLPLIIAHDDRTLPVGIVEELTIEGKELRGVLRFSKTQDSVWQDVQDGILRNLSIGYLTMRIEPPEKGEYRVSKWQPYECSLVAAGADPTAQINNKRTLKKENKKMDINDLKKTRKKAQDKMVGLAANEKLNDDQKKELRSIKAEIETLDMQIEAFEMVDGTRQQQSDQTPPITIHGAENNAKPFSSEEYIRAYDKFLRHGRAALYPDEIRVLTVGSDPSMGYAVPDEFEKKLVKKLHENNIMRSLCKVISTSSDRKIPIVVGDSLAYWINENGEYTESDIELAQKTLGAHKLGVLTLASEELAFDSAFDLTELLSDNFGRAMGDKEEDAFINGDGNEKPTGILEDAELGVTSASASTFTYGEVLDLIYELKRPYRKRASFLMSDEAMKMIRQFVDGNGQYLVKEPTQQGEPTTIMGYPVQVSNFVPAPTAGNKAVLFGDFSYYWIADRRGRFFQELREKYAHKGQIGYRANQRVDGKLVLPEAVKVLKMKA